jgi:hypothetical protein
MNKISTKLLLTQLEKNKGKVFEVSLNNGFFNATHFLSWGGKLLYDTGIDSQEIKWIRKDFLNWYSEAYWVIEQIIS